MYFSDSDAYKWLEAASWALAGGPDSELEQLVGIVIQEVADAQRPDGYLNTYFALEKAAERWTNFDLHEMYCAGHLFQAAVAHYRATGKTSLLEVATRFADHICDTFGPEEKGKRRAVDGHEEVEMALVELYRATGNKRYLEQAKFFIEARGRGLLGRPYGNLSPEYAQDHKPARELDLMVGHAVRAVYYNAGIADVYAELNDEGYKVALERLWRNMTTKRMYVTGGIGSRYEGEAFGKDYELPNDRAYTETCAAIGSVMWNWRMLALDGDARYSDLIEWTVYNAVLPGLSLDGQRYFYQNPLADDGSHRRQPWFGCACCPPNVARLLASLPGYVYSTSDEGLWVHLYAESAVDTHLPDGQQVKLTQHTRYPWDGEIVLEVTSEGEFALMLRIPGWCEEGATLSINGEASSELKPGSYARIARSWQAGDTVRLSLPMPVRYLEAHPYVFEAAGRVALARGPILYCVEGVDHPGLDVRDLVVPEDSSRIKALASDLLGGVTVLAAPARALSLAGDYLYRTRSGHSVPTRPATLTAIPYFAWANREPAPMQVWLRLAGWLE
jgi:DUF1680 family protein